MARRVKDITRKETRKVEEAICDRCGRVFQDNSKRYGFAPVEACEVCKRDVCHWCRKIEWFDFADIDDKHVICLDCYEHGRVFMQEIGDIVSWRHEATEEINREYEKRVQKVLERWRKHIEEGSLGESVEQG